eukprot:4091969-Amphidinium_carterae.1
MALLLGRDLVVCQGRHPSWTEQLVCAASYHPMKMHQCSQKDGCPTDCMRVIDPAKSFVWQIFITWRNSKQLHL